MQMQLSLLVSGAKSVPFGESNLTNQCCRTVRESYAILVCSLTGEKTKWRYAPIGFLASDYIIADYELRNNSQIKFGFVDGRRLLSAKSKKYSFFVEIIGETRTVIYCKNVLRKLYLT